MRIIELSVSGVEIDILVNQPLIAGSVGDVGCTFSFSKDWDPLTKVAVFTGGSESRSVILDGSTVELPWETLQVPKVAYLIGVYGYDAGRLVRETTPQLVGYVRCGTGRSAQTAAAPSPSIQQQLITATAQAVRAAEEATKRVSVLFSDGDGTRFLSDDGSYKEVSTDALPDALPNPYLLRFKGASTAEYDGSNEVEVEIPVGGSGDRIIAYADGESIVLNDSSDRQMRGLTLYGRTTQNGTPTPTNPLPLVNAGTDGDIAVSVSNGSETQTLTVSTPSGLPGVPVRSGGNYTDGNGQQWVCDEIDFERGVYVQRVHRDVVSSGSFITLYAGIAYFWGIQYDTDTKIKRDIPLVSNRFVTSSDTTPTAVGTALVKTVADNGWQGKARILLHLPAEVTTDAEVKAWVDNNEVQIYYPLPAPVETPLSDDEIAACKALRTYKPTTTILNDGGADMEVMYIPDNRTANYIDDLIKNGTGGTTNHAQLTSRDAADQHPISAIAGLEPALSRIADGFELDGSTLYLTRNGVIVSTGIELPATESGGGFGSTLRLVNGMDSNQITFIDSDDPADIIFTVTSVDSDTAEPTGDISCSWYVGQTRVAVSTVQQGENSFNIRKHIKIGDNSVKLTVADSYGNSRSFVWTITVTSYSLTWNLGDIANHNSNSLAIRLVPSGEGDKTVKVTVDGKSVYNEIISTSGRTVTTSIPAQSHGAHIIEAWLETEVGGETVTTQKLKHTGVWVDGSSDTPIVAISTGALSVAQFATANVRYMVYDPLHEPTTVSLKANGEVVNTLTDVSRGEQVWAYLAAEMGSTALAIDCRGETAELALTVADIGYDIAPVTTGLVMDLNPTGHSNTESGYNSFGYIDGDGVNHPLTFSEGFDWVNGGFQLDNEGVTAFVVKRGDFVTFDRSLFNDNARTNGKEIKIIFKVTNCRDYDAEILNCVSDGVGLKLQAQQAVLSSELSSTTVLYCEDSKIEMDINIEADNEDSIATIWLEGVPSRAFAFTSSDSWTQVTPQLLRIGSAEADVWIYRAKMYGNSLTRNDILDNFIADCADTDEMISRYERNDIFDSTGAISIDKLQVASPELRIIHIEADKMTVSKSDEVSCSVTMIYPNGGESAGFTASGVIMKAQGTSSMDYIDAGLNLDLDFSGAEWLDGADNAITGYSLTPDSIPVDYLNVKVNIASSENANNVVLADDYNAFQPNVTMVRASNSKVRDTVEGHPCAVFFTNTSGETITINNGARTVAAGETVLYACGDLNNSKKNFAVFGQNRTEYPDICCVEIANNVNAPCLYKVPVPDTETWDGNEDTSNFEFRFPKKPTDTDKQRWRVLVAWVASTDRTAATGNALDNAVTYGGVTYTTDTAEYRAAKFRAEVADHFSVDSLLYHYLFTERHCMTDNRAKNTFCSYEPDVDGVYRWNFNKDYDNDTAEGNDNIGGLTFTYGLEDTDMVGESYVFNASDSVLWVNVRDLLAAELQAMFLDRESKGAWSKDRFLEKMDAYQAIRPEALVAEDMWGKYYSAYLSAGNASYLAKMLGTKKDQRRQFETYQEGYMSSKYRGSVASTDAINLRANAQAAGEGNIPGIVPYADMYLRVKYGTAGEFVTRAKKGVTYDAICPASTLNDVETNIYLGSNIASVGSFSSVKPKYVNAANARKLQQFVVGDGTVDYRNTGFDITSTAFENDTFIELIDLRNLSNAADSTKVSDLDLSRLTALEEIYLDGCEVVTGITFAEGAPVRVAQLNDLRLLSACNLTKLADFSMGTDNLQRLRVENCPAIDTLELCVNAERLNRIRLIGIDWELSDGTVFEKLVALSGLDGSGNEIPEPIIRGTVHFERILDSTLAQIQATFPDLTVTYDVCVSPLTLIPDEPWTPYKRGGTSSGITINEDGTISYEMKNSTSAQTTTVYSVHCDTLVDFSRYTTLTYVLDITQWPTSGQVVIDIKNYAGTTGAPTNGTIPQVLTDASMGMGVGINERTVDISEWTDPGYLGFYSSMYHGNAKFTITSVILR